MDIAICAIAKNENLYIREWIEWHHAIGVTHICLYDNNDVEHLEDVISDYIESGYVVLHNVRGKEKGLSYDSNMINLQPHCYIEAYEALSPSFDWIIFIDIDEFIDLDSYQDLGSFLSQDKFSDFDTILLNWKTYDDNDYVVSTGNVHSSYDRVSKWKKGGVKSIVRTKSTIYDKHIRNLIHTFRLEGGKVCFSNGEQVILTNKNNWYEALPMSNMPVCLAHYKTKSLDEYIKRHVGRHWGTGPLYEKSPTTFDECIHSYFLYNNQTFLKDMLISTYMSELDLTNTVDYEGIFRYLQTYFDRTSDMSHDKRFISPLSVYCYDTLLLRKYCLYKIGYDICPTIIRECTSFDDISLDGACQLKCNAIHNDQIRQRYNNERKWYSIGDRISKWLAYEDGKSKYVKKRLYIEELIPNMTPEYTLTYVNGNYVSTSSNVVGSGTPPTYDDMKRYASILSDGFIYSEICFYDLNGKCLLKHMDCR